MCDKPLTAWHAKKAQTPVDISEINFFLLVPVKACKCYGKRTFGTHVHVVQTKAHQQIDRAGYTVYLHLGHQELSCTYQVHQRQGTIAVG